MATSCVLQRAIAELAEQGIIVKLVKHYEDVKGMSSPTPALRNAANAAYPKVGIKPPKNGYVELEIRGLKIEEIKHAMEIMDNVVEVIQKSVKK